MKLICEKETELPKIAGEILAAFPEDRVFAFYGKMGAGKTTFIKVLCEQLNVMDVVNSPTFAIINEYITQEDDSIYHFDFYRIKEHTEAMDIGFDDYIYSGMYCLMEWPEKVEAILPESHIRIEVTADDTNGNRTFNCVRVGE